MTGKLLVFDTETTAANPEEARIVSAYLGLLAEDGSILTEKEWIVQPDGWVIPDEAAAIHGISTEDATERGAPLEDVLREICQIIATQVGAFYAPLAGQNLQYDLTLLDREMKRLWPGSGVQEVLGEGVVLDSLVIDKEIDKYRKGKRILTAMTAHYGVSLSEEEAHGARADAVAAGRVIQAMARHPKGGVLRALPLRVLHQKQIQWKADQAASLQHYFRTKGGEPDAVVRGEWPYIPAATAA
jgi:DNA polymerase-3 subunit epsilon